MYYVKQIKIGPFHTSELELSELFKAWVVISAAFAIMLSSSILTLEFLYNFLLAALTVGIGFLAHELAHKTLAQRFGCIAEFRAFNMMLVLSLAMSFFGFVFAAPGAVMIQGHIDRRKNGMISAAGPMMNIILGLIFLTSSFFFVSNIIKYGFWINAWLALFNTLPFPGFDGVKIWYWNKAIYLSMFLMSVGLMLFITTV